MIELRCPNLEYGSGEISFNDSEVENAKTFKCDNCDKEFNLNKAEWEEI